MSKSIYLKLRRHMFLRSFENNVKVLQYNNRILKCFEIFQNTHSKLLLFLYKHLEFQFQMYRTIEKRIALKNEIYI